MNIDINKIFKLANDISRSKRVLVEKDYLNRLIELRKRLANKYGQSLKVNKLYFKTNILLFTSVELISKEVLIKNVFERILSLEPHIDEQLLKRLDHYQTKDLKWKIYSSHQKEVFDELVNSILKKLIATQQEHTGQAIKLFYTDEAMYKTKILNILFEEVITKLESLDDNFWDDFAQKIPKISSSEKKQKTRVVLEPHERQRIKETEETGMLIILNLIKVHGLIKRAAIDLVGNKIYADYSESSRKILTGQLISKMLKKEMMGYIGEKRARQYCAVNDVEMYKKQLEGAVIGKEKIAMDCLVEYLQTNNFFNQEIAFSLFKEAGLPEKNSIALFYSVCKLLKQRDIIVRAGAPKNGRFYRKDYADQHLLVNGEYISEYLKKTMDFYHYIKKNEPEILSLSTIRDYLFSLIINDPIDKNLTPQQIELRQFTILRNLRIKYGLEIPAYSIYGTRLNSGPKPKPKN